MLFAKHRRFTLAFVTITYAMFDSLSAVKICARDGDLQRADGAAFVSVTSRDGRTAISDVYQRAPCKALFPLVDGRECSEVVFLNTAGGVTGGDRLQYSIAASGAACLTGTTQAAERIYRALDRPGRIETRLSVDDEATLQWLPQETILFDGGRLSRLTEIRLAPAARLIALEWLLFGRTAHGETVTCGEVMDRWRVFRDDRLIWADNFRLGGDIARQIARPALFGGCIALATVFYAAPDAAQQIERARSVLQSVMTEITCQAGATAVAGSLICRFAATTALSLRSAVIYFLKGFCERLDGFPPSLPRVWAC